MASNDVLGLQQPLKAGGIRSVNFFNGRLLTGKDLSREQAARREGDARLGLAIGDGVAFGLEVGRDNERSTESAPVLCISSGLAVNCRGQTLRLTAPVSVALTRRFDTETSTCTFNACEPVVAGIYVAGAGVYVLSIAPAEAAEGRAPSNGLDPTNVRCNTDATVEGLQFRLHGLSASQPLTTLGLGQPWFRNALAYRCFGEDQRATWFADPLNALARHDGIRELVATQSLTEYDVPLALVYITGTGNLEFVDEWAVRRPLSHASADALASLVDARREALGRAMYLQFERHVLDAAPPNGDLSPLTARGHFRFLPPAGVLPVPEEPGVSDGAATRFFAGMKYRGPTFVNAARVEGLLRESLVYPPIDTQADEMIWLYRVRENRMTRDAPRSAGNLKVPRSYLVFASGHISYRGDAQFDLSSWNYANYALER